MEINDVPKERVKIVTRAASITSEEKISPLHSPKLGRRLDSLNSPKLTRRNSSFSENTTETLSDLFSIIATEERKQAGKRACI